MALLKELEADVIVVIMEAEVVEVLLQNTLKRKMILIKNVIILY
jgi:hypothetical protein